MAYDFGAQNFGNPYRYGQAEYNPNGDSYNGQTGSQTPQSTLNALNGQAGSTKSSNPFDAMVSHATALNNYIGGYSSQALRGGDDGPGRDRTTPPSVVMPPANTAPNPIAGHPLHPSTGNPNLPSDAAPFGPGNPAPPGQMTNLTPPPETITPLIPPAPPAPTPTPEQTTPTPTPTPGPALAPPQLPATPEALNPHNTQDVISFIHNQYRPYFQQQQTDLQRQLAQTYAANGGINSGGYGDVLGREEARLIGQQGQQEGDLVSTATQNDFNRQLQKYGIDVDAAIRNYIAQSNNNLGMAGNDVERENNIMRYILGLYGLGPEILNSLFPYTPGGIISPSQPPLNPPVVTP